MKAKIVTEPVFGGWQARLENWSANPLLFAIEETRHSAEQRAVRWAMSEGIVFEVVREQQKETEEAKMTIDYVNAIRGKCIEAGMPDADGRHMMTLEVEFLDLRDFPHNPLMADFVMLPKDQFDRLVEPLREQLCKRLLPDRAVAVDAKS